MKKLVFILAILAVFNSCSDDVQFNDPGFQAYRDGALWKAVEVKATKSASGIITINASIQDEELSLKTISQNKGRYVLGTTTLNNMATFTSSYDNNIVDYSTAPIFGSVSTVSSLVSAGTGYSSGTSVATTNTGSGIGLTVRITANNDGVITEVKVSSPGNNYKAGDLITITGGNNNAKFRVQNVEGSNGEIVITESGDGTITGTFKFNASNFDLTNGQKIVNFQYGNFYKLAVFPE